VGAGFVPVDDFGHDVVRAVLLAQPALGVLEKLILLGLGGRFPPVRGGGHQVLDRHHGVLAALFGQALAQFPHGFGCGSCP